MLERATACLKAGARDSLQCTRAQVLPLGSRRQLPSTFWAHDAGDTGIDIRLFWAGGLAGAERIFPHDDIDTSRGPKSRRGGKERRSVTSILSSEVPLLDFLYPPHALAWLQRGLGQLRERQQPRIAKRISEGFLQASRGYSSRLHARPSKAISQHGGTADDSPKAAPHGSSHVEKDNSSSSMRDDVDPAGEEFESDTTASARVERLPGNINPATRDSPTQHLQEEDGRLSKQGVAARNTVDMVRELAPSAEEANEPAEEIMEENNDALAASSPDALSDHETQHSHEVANPLESLRTIMSGRRKEYSVDDIDHAWLLFTSLSETAKADPRLIHELLLWFAKIDVETAQAHSISLYWSLPVASRTLRDHDAVLNAFLARKAYDTVAGVHKEALHNIPNGHQITKKLFQHAVHHDNWPLALAVKEQLDGAFEGDARAKAHHQELFWINVTETPNLLEKANNLVRRCQSFLDCDRKHIKKLTALSAKLSEVAFRQTMLRAPSNWKMTQANQQRWTIARLLLPLNSIRLWAPNGPQLFEEFLIKLLELNQSEDQYRQVHDLVSYIYGHYRKMQNVQFPVDMLQNLLSRVLPYASHLRQLRFSTYSVSIEVIVEDWQKQHAVLSCWAVKKLMSYYARQGMLEPLAEYYTYLERHYPAYGDQKSALWALIYAHARRCEPEKAQEAFDHVEKVAKLNGDSADLKCWNILMHAHARADNLVEGLDTLSRMVDGAKLLPDEQTIHPLLEMLARRGDSDGIEDVLQQYDSLTGARHATSFVGSYMRALIHSGEVSKAEQRLKEAIQQSRTHEIKGSLTGCFNIMISAYAQCRDLEGTTRTWRWMKAENIWPDRNTYTCLMLALIHYRQAPAAYTIMTRIMRKEGLRATAIHYAIVMAGMVNQGLYEQAIGIHQKMAKNNIRPSLATHRNYIKALAMNQKAKRTAFNPDGEPAPLMQVIGELEDALVTHDGSAVANKDPVFGHDPTAGSEDLREHFVTVLFQHGHHRCFEAVHELFRMYLDATKKAGKRDAALPMHVLVAMMNAHFRNGEYDQVEAYWNMAKDNAHAVASKIAIPDYQHSQPSSSQASEDATVKSNKANLVDATGSEVDRAEIKFEANRSPAEQELQTVLPASLPRMATGLAPGHRFILSRPFRYFLDALAAQNRIPDVLNTFTALVRQGYAFDPLTWNRLIQHLCTSSPPLTLLAFTLTERYLIANFPGWSPQYKSSRHPRKSAVSAGLQYIRGRYLGYDTLVPQYRTMVLLIAALLKLRRMEATGSGMAKGETGRYIGTVREIQAVAPRTWDAVNSMPQVETDRIQHMQLRSDEANAL